MKKIGFFIASLFALNVFANQTFRPGELLGSDLSLSSELPVVPVVGSTNDVPYKPAGLMFYVVGQGLKIVNQNGATESVSASGSAPIVSNETSTGERLERASIANNGTCSISSQSNAWLASASHSATGICQLTFSTSMFSGAPTCTCSYNGTGSAVCSVYSASSSTVEIKIETSGGPQDHPFNVICMGPK